MNRNDDLVGEVKRALRRPRQLVEGLGLKVQKDAGSYVFVFCPWHEEKTPSCSVHEAGDTVNAKCWGCKRHGSALDFIAAVKGFDERTQFRDVLAIGCDLAGFYEQAEALRAGREPPKPKERPAPRAPKPPKEYPPEREVRELWDTSIQVTDDAAARTMLEGRGIDPGAVAGASLARVLRRDMHATRIPRWARHKGEMISSLPWTETGHRMILRAYDSDGEWRSVRAWKIEGDLPLPKRVPPSGCRSKGLVLANAPAAEWLRGERRPSRIVATEGEPDFVVRSVMNPSEAVIGIISGSWHDGYAERVPYGSEVVVLTHLDKAGDGYANEIIRSVEGRAIVRRWTLSEETAA